jgi:hypothetical protein
LAEAAARSAALWVHVEALVDLPAAAQRVLARAGSRPVFAEASQLAAASPSRLRAAAELLQDGVLTGATLFATDADVAALSQGGAAALVSASGLRAVVVWHASDARLRVWQGGAARAAEDLPWELEGSARVAGMEALLSLYCALCAARCAQGAEAGAEPGRLVRAAAAFRSAYNQARRQSGGPASLPAALVDALAAVHDDR